MKGLGRLKPDRVFRHSLVLLVALAWAPVVRADFVNPATLELIEIAPGRFRVTFTLPLIKGRILKATPVLPEICVMEGEPVERGGTGSVVRTWIVRCRPSDLIGLPIGVDGLLGTSQQIQFTLSTLGGRNYQTQLGPTTAFFTLDPPPTFMALVRKGGKAGLQSALQHSELVLLFSLMVFLTNRMTTCVLLVTLFSLSQTLGQWLGTQDWMTVSAFVPQAWAASFALLAASALMSRRVTPLLQWRDTFWMAVCFLGLLYGGAHPGSIDVMGLSFGEQQLALLTGGLGAIAGLGLLCLCVRELQVAMEGLSPRMRSRWVAGIAYLSGALAFGMFLYKLSTPLYSGSVPPEVVLTLLMAVVLGLWCRVKVGPVGLLPLLVVVHFAAGTLLSLKGVMLPWDSFVLFALLASLAIALSARSPRFTWTKAGFLSIAALFQGHYVANYLRDATALPLSHATALGVTVCLVIYACTRVLPEAGSQMTRLPTRLFGLMAAGLAIAWRLFAYRDGFAVEFATERAMGQLLLPVLALLLLLCAVMAWPRKRRFAGQHGGTPTHWVLIGLAFFALPVGTVSVRDPFYRPRPPTPVEAQRIMDKLLTDTYLAFNLKDEDAAFDRLESTLSADLVSDVYLDSRRRLTAGIRQGATVTVKDVSVMSVEEAVSTTQGAQSFTYPVKWAVTARVRHLKHIHYRRNIYRGELTISIDENRWKIMRLVLKSEERVIVPWQKT